jgi:hypothetical protein
MQHHPTPRRRLRAACAVAVACTAASVGAAGARGADGAACPSSVETPYTMQLRALTGPAGADLTVTVRVDPATQCAPVAVLKKVQLKTFAADGTVAATRNLSDRPAPGGATTLDLGTVPRDRRVEADVLVQTGNPERTFVVRGATTTLLRPDLVVQAITPKQALAGTPFSVRAVIVERNGDVGASADVSLSAIPGSVEHVTVPKGGSATVVFPEVTFESPQPVEVTATISGAEPAETAVTNNALTATVDVTASQLASPYRVLFPSLGGFGAQFNQHLWAPVTAKPPGDPATVRERVLDLQPELVRIFYNDIWDANAKGDHPEWQLNYDSFVQTCLLAQDAGATINVTFHTYVIAVTDPEGSMAKFAQVLDDLVRGHGCTAVRWATVGNEPNNGSMTLPMLNTLYRALDAQLVANGLRDHIGLMGGDLVESRSGAQTHYDWMKWIGANMNDVLDAYSEHVYWWYDRPLRLEFRLRDILNLMTNVLPADQRKPTYLMEFGIRGAAACPGKPNVTNLYHLPECSEIWRTNIAGFQQFWFDVESAQLGFAGTSKWDAYQATYDNTKNPPQIYWLTGPASEGYPLTPSYNALSLVFHTTAPGWQVLGIDPWAADDWTVPEADYGTINGASTNDTPEQELVGFYSGNTDLTILGLDTHGKDLNTVSADPPSQYSIGGLPPNAAFTLAVWNATGDGTNSIEGTVATNAAGVARFEVPLQAAFALTTVPVS